MKNERTQRDIDIIRQSSLKAAVDLTIGMLPQLDDQTEISDLVLRVAGKFNTWVLDGNGSSQVQDEVTRIRREVAADPPREAKRDEPDTTWDKFMHLKDNIASDPDKYLPLRTDEWAESDGKWLQRGQTTFGASPGDPYPISKKQFGFLVGLHKERTLDTDTRFLLGLSTHGASDLIEHIQDMPKNGNGKKQLADARSEIRRRRL